MVSRARRLASAHRVGSGERGIRRLRDARLKWATRPGGRGACLPLVGASGYAEQAAVASIYRGLAMLPSHIDLSRSRVAQAGAEGIVLRPALARVAPGLVFVLALGFVAVMAYPRPPRPSPDLEAMQLRDAVERARADAQARGVPFFPPPLPRATREPSGPGVRRARMAVSILAGLAACALACLACRHRVVMCVDKARGLLHIDHREAIERRSYEAQVEPPRVIVVRRAFEAPQGRPPAAQPKSTWRILFRPGLDLPALLTETAAVRPAGQGAPAKTTQIAQALSDMTGWPVEKDSSEPADLD